jgi:hypothetical protein
MRHLELIFSFIVLTSMTLITVAALQVLNSIDLNKNVVTPILMRGAK